MPARPSSLPFATSPFLQLTPFRTHAALERLRARIWVDPTPVMIEATEPSPRLLSLAEARHLKRHPLPGPGNWGRLFDQRWSRLLISPAARGRRWLHWDEEGEATLYLGGVPYYGFDVAHRHCELPPGVREAWVESVAVQAAIWHPDAHGLSPEGNRFRGAALMGRDEDAWSDYHDLLCLHDLMIEERARAFPELGKDLRPMVTQRPLQGVSPFLRRLLRGLDDAVNALDVGDVMAMRRRLAELYGELRTDRPLVRAAVVGNSHLDLVWLWPERIGEAKAVHTFANVNYLFRRYPEMRFTYSQPASYEAVNRRAPALYRAVQTHIDAGRWEATGALYVESDSHVACGEGLLRAFTMGQAGFEQIAGRRSRLLWLPDLFGFTGCLPQLMRLAGVDYFFTTKLQWNALNRFPHSTFVWRGVDGSEVLAHIPQQVGLNNGLTVSDLRAVTLGHPQSDVHPEALCPCGYGDGGGGPSDEICERARRLSALGDLPALGWDQPEAFFDRAASRRPRLPVHYGELYLEAHRGIYTTRRRLKHAFRSLERALQVREAVACAQGEAPDLGHAWRRMIFAQFHDYIPGSAIPDVYEEGLPELERLARDLTRDSARALQQATGRRCVFNPLPLKRTVVVNGRTLQLPPAAGVLVEDAAHATASPVTAKGLTLDNGIVQVRVDRRGHLANLAFNGRRIALRPGAGALALYADKPAHHPAWEIDRASLASGKIADTRAKITTTANALVIQRRIGRASEATLRYWLEPGSAALRVTVDLDWREPETLLKMYFDTEYRGRDMRSGLPFGSILRPNQPTGPHAESMWEFPASRYVCVSDDTESEGLSLIAESHYGFSCRDGNLAVSLVRSPLHVGADHYVASYPPTLRRGAPAPHTDIGRHSMHFALAAYSADAAVEEQPAALAESLFTPVVPYVGEPCASPFQGTTGGDSLVPCWLEPLGKNGFVVRLHETLGRAGTATVRLADRWSAMKVDLQGQCLANIPSSGELAFRPYEIVSLRLSRNA